MQRSCRNIQTGRRLLDLVQEGFRGISEVGMRVYLAQKACHRAIAALLGTFLAE